jgi:hypothetical protein
MAQMEEIENFKQIFSYTPNESTVAINLVENGANAKIRHLNIIAGGVNLVSFSEDYSDRVGQLFKKSSHCTRNADGIIAFENFNGKNLLLCEMKSSGGGVFNSAFQQVLSSYLKMCMLFSMCDEFQISNFRVFFIFTSQDGVELAQRLNELEQIDVSQRTFIDNIRLELLKGKRVRFKLSSVPHNLSFLHKDFIEQEVECQLLKSETDVIDFDVNTL